jgi:hypothetical protein
MILTTPFAGCDTEGGGEDTGMKRKLYCLMYTSSHTFFGAPFSAFDCADLQESIIGDISGVQECGYTNSDHFLICIFCNFFFNLL